MTSANFDEATLERARDLLRTSLVWDNHTCLPLRPHDERFLPQIDRLHAAGVDAVSVNAGFGPQTLENHLRMLASFRRWFRARAERYVLVDTVADVDHAKERGALAVTFDVEGMAPLDGGDDGIVELLRDLGVRWMCVAYNRNNRAGGGCYDDDGGLSAHGRALLREMKRVGMIVCCSHTGHRTARDAIEAADNPVIFSHSNPSAVHAHARNIPDDLLDACAATGGVVGINGIGPFLGDDRPATLVRHLDYAVQRVGPDHVGISLDYVFDARELADYLTTLCETFPDGETYAEAPQMVPPEAYVEITAGLCGLGYPNDAVRKILGENWRRVAGQVWRG